MLIKKSSASATISTDVSRSRASIAMFGSLLAFGSCFIKAAYSVTFAPPEHSRYSRIDLLHLASFRSGAANPTLPGTQLISFNAFAGPLDIHIAVAAVAFMFVVGLLASLTSKLHIDTARSGVGKVLTVTGHSFSVGAAIIGVGSLIWSFRDRHQPAAIRKTFISDLGGGDFARHASRYLSSQAEFGAFVLLGGLVIGCVAIYATKGARVVAVVTTGLICALVLFGGS